MDRIRFIGGRPFREVSFLVPDFAVEVFSINLKNALAASVSELESSGVRPDGEKFDVQDVSALASVIEYADRLPEFDADPVKK